MCAFVELSDRVTVMHHDFVEGTCVIVTGDSMTMVIDSGAYPGHSRSLNEHLSSRGLACDVLALTHGHGDHVAGVLGIEARGVVSHPAALERALMAVRTIATWSDRQPDEVALELCNRLGFSELPEHLDLGGVVVEVIPSPGHTSDSVCFSVEGILVGGDTVVTNIPPAFADGNSNELIATLQHLSGEHWLGLVPGHGPVLEDQAKTVSWLRNQLRYMEKLRSVTETVLETSPAREAIEEIAGSVKLEGLRRSDDVERRLRNNARVMITEMMADG